MSEKPNLLVIDGDADLVASVTMVMEDAGWEVHSADNGLSGIEQARQDVPDLVILDMLMPRQDGLTTYEQLRSDPAPRARGDSDHRVDQRFREARHRLLRRGLQGALRPRSRSFPQEALRADDTSGDGESPAQAAGLVLYRRRFPTKPGRFGSIQVFCEQNVPWNHGRASSLQKT